MASIPLLLTKGAANTWFPMSKSGFRPEIRERNKSASALGSTCWILPGKITTGILLLAFSLAIVSGILLPVTKLPPTKNKSTPWLSAWAATRSMAASSTSSGSTRTAKSFRPFWWLCCINDRIFKVQMGYRAKLGYLFVGFNLYGTGVNFTLLLYAHVVHLFTRWKGKVKIK